MSVCVCVVLAWLVVWLGVIGMMLTGGWGWLILFKRALVALVALSLQTAYVIPDSRYTYHPDTDIIRQKFHA